MRVDPRLLLGDPALVDQGLHEGVVVGELGERAVAEEVGAAVADVADADPGPSKSGDGRGGAGAVERGVLVDQLGDPVVGAVQRAGDLAEQVVSAVSGPGGSSSRRSCAIAVLEAMSPRAAPPTPSQTASSHGPAYPESWLSLRTRPTSESARSQARPQVVGIGYFLSSRIVLPMRTWVPRVIVVGWVIRTVPT